MTGGRRLDYFTDRLSSVPVDEVDGNLLRYRFPILWKRGWGGDTRQLRGLTLGLLLLPSGVRKILEQLLNDIPMIHEHWEVTVNNFKVLSQVVGQYNISLGPDWMYLRAIENALGYPPGDDPEIDLRVREWFATKPRKELPWGNLFLRYLRGGNGEKRSITLGVDLFYGDYYNWVTSGASTGRFPDILVDGERFRVRSSKWASAMFLGTEQIKKIVRTPVAYKLTVIQKRERGKPLARAVVNASLESFLQMSWIWYLLEPILMGGYSPINMDSRQS